MIKNKYLQVTEEIINNHIFRIKYNEVEIRKEQWEDQMIEKYGNLDNSDFLENEKCPNFDEEFNEDEVLIDLKDK